MSLWTQSTRRQHPSTGNQTSPLLSSSSSSSMKSFSSRLTRRSIFIIIVSLATILLFPSLVTAQLPPGPQPGIGVDYSVASTDPGAAAPTISQDSNTNHATITMSITATGVPKPTIITTVAVVSGTTTTLTTVITGAVGTGVSGAMGAQGTGLPVPAITSTLPKAPQSILVVQSTTYGKILPAAGPVDDQIQSHFWDQFVARPEDSSGKKSSSSSSIRLSSSMMSRCSMLFGLLVAICLIRI